MKVLNKDTLKKEYTLFIVEDEIVNFTLLRNLIKSNFESINFKFLNAKNKEEFLEVLNKNEIDIIFMDYELEDVNGTELTKIINENYSQIPVIFLTGAYEENVLEKAFEAGAVEFMHKPFKRTELISRLYNQMRIKKLIDELNFYAFYDELTKIYNRRQFFKIAEKLFYEKDNIFIAMIDLDNFKKVNDKYGHDIGDQVLIKFSNILKEVVNKNKKRDKYIIGRYGGEEFVIIGEYSNKKEIKKFFDDLINEIRKNLFINVKNKKLYVTLSIGIKIKDEEVFLDELLKEADKLLYNAKNQGKDQYILK